MSGVEAAGFVLAAFPLLISALEHYRESAEVLKDWWRYKREYRKVKVRYEDPVARKLEINPSSG